MTGRPRNAVLGALLVAGGCSSKPLTEIMLEVSTDLAVPAEMDAIEVEITGTGKPVSTMLVIAGTDGGTRPAQPYRIGLLPEGSESAAFTVRLAAYRSQIPLLPSLSQTAMVAFVPGKVLALPMELHRSCLGVPCSPPSTTCRLGQCTSSRRDSLEPYRPPGAQEPDGGRTEGGAADGGRAEPGGADAGRDADGGARDAGTGA